MSILTLLGTVYAQTQLCLLTFTLSSKICKVQCCSIDCTSSCMGSAYDSDKEECAFRVV